MAVDPSDPAYFHVQYANQKEAQNAEQRAKRGPPSPLLNVIVGFMMLWLARSFYMDDEIGTAIFFVLLTAINFGVAIKVWTARKGSGE